MINLRTRKENHLSYRKLKNKLRATGSEPWLNFTHPNDDVAERVRGLLTRIKQRNRRLAIEAVERKKERRREADRLRIAQKQRQQEYEEFLERQRIAAFGTRFHKLPFDIQVHIGKMLTPSDLMFWKKHRRCFHEAFLRQEKLVVDSSRCPGATVLRMSAHGGFRFRLRSLELEVRNDLVESQSLGGKKLMEAVATLPYLKKLDLLVSSREYLQPAILCGVEDVRIEGAYCKEVNGMFKCLPSVERLLIDKPNSRDGDFVCNLALVVSHCPKLRCLTFARMREFEAITGWELLPTMPNLKKLQIKMRDHSGRLSDEENVRRISVISFLESLLAPTKVELVVYIPPPPPPRSVSHASSYGDPSEHGQPEEEMPSEDEDYDDDEAEHNLFSQSEETESMVWEWGGNPASLFSESESEWEWGGNPASLFSESLESTTSESESSVSYSEDLAWGGHPGSLFSDSESDQSGISPPWGGHEESLFSHSEDSDSDEEAISEDRPYFSEQLWRKYNHRLRAAWISGEFAWGGHPESLFSDSSTDSEPCVELTTRSWRRFLRNRELEQDAAWMKRFGSFLPRDDHELCSLLLEEIRMIELGRRVAGETSASKYEDAYL